MQEQHKTLPDTTGIEKKHYDVGTVTDLWLRHRRNQRRQEGGTMSNTMLASNILSEYLTPGVSLRLGVRDTG